MKKADVIPIERLNYTKVRSEFRDGDIVLYKGKSWISKLIGIFTRSKYSHAGICSWWNDRLMVMEAVGKGAVTTPLSFNIRNYHGDVEWFRCTNEILEGDRIKMIIYAQEELGKEYNNLQLILIGLYIMLGIKFDPYDKYRRERKLFCSLYVSQIFNSVGIDLVKNISDSFTSPDAIARSPLLKRMGVLKVNKSK